MLFEVQAHGFEVAARVGIVQAAAQGGLQHQAGGLADECRYPGENGIVLHLARDLLFELFVGAQ